MNSQIGSAKRRIRPWRACWPSAFGKVRRLMLQYLWIYFTLRREGAKKPQPTSGEFLSARPCRVSLESPFVPADLQPAEARPIAGTGNQDTES
jgi:hypothetical protein